MASTYILRTLFSVGKNFCVERKICVEMHKHLLRKVHNCPSAQNSRERNPPRVDRLGGCTQIRSAAEQGGFTARSWPFTACGSPLHIHDMFCFSCGGDTPDSEMMGATNLAEPAVPSRLPWMAVWIDAGTKGHGVCAMGGFEPCCCWFT